MIIELALLAVAIWGGGKLASIIAEYWDDVRRWLKRASDQVAKMIAGAIYGVRYFVQRVGQYYKQISRNYSKNHQNQWEETIVTRQIQASEVPPEILAAASYNEIEQSQRLRELLA